MGSRLLKFQGFPFVVSWRQEKIMETTSNEEKKENGWERSPTRFLLFGQSWVLPACVLSHSVTSSSLRPFGPWPAGSSVLEYSSGRTQVPSHFPFHASVPGQLDSLCPRACPEVLSQRAILGALPHVLRLLSVWAPTAGWAPVPTPASACRPPEFSSPLLVEIGAPSEESMVLPYALSAGFVETCSRSVVSWVWWTHFKSYIRFSAWTKPPPVPRFQFLEEGINPSLSNTVIRE